MSRINQQVEAAALDVIERTYDRYRAGGLRREPCLTATAIVESMPYISDDWHFSTRRNQVSMVRNALGRLKRKGRVGSSIGEGLTGREARCWEPK